MPRVSVLMPLYNAEATVATSIASALALTGAEVEVIAIDDASTDATVDVVGAIAAGEPRLKLLRSPSNGGPGAARARGLSAATGDWVAILDADDTFEPDRLARLVALAEAEGLDAIADNLALVDPGLGSREQSDPAPATPSTCFGEVVGLAFPLDEDALIPITAERFLQNTRPAGRVNLGWMQPVIRRDVLTRHSITWPSLRHAEDAVFTMRLLLSGARLALTGWPGYRYTQRRGTVSGQASAFSRTRRSTDEQIGAIRLIEQEAAGRLSPGAERRLRLMPGEIAATTAVLEMRDALSSRAPGQALRAAPGLLRHPVALCRCLYTRFGPGAARLE
ncbi:MAG: glycosyltransferase family 2 protein [Pseudomonadota bacterium]